MQHCPQVVVVHVDVLALDQDALHEPALLDGDLVQLLLDLAVWKCVVGAIRADAARL